jgi:hypothetical protein
MLCCLCLSPEHRTVKGQSGRTSARSSGPQATLNFATVTWLTPSNLATDRALSPSARRRAAYSRW